jgi:hypothetical protein
MTTQPPRFLGRACVGALIAASMAAGTFLGAEPAAAQETSVQSGWWSSSPVLAPDAPADGLVIQGGPDANAPTAYAAVAGVLAPATKATRLTLAVAPGSATTPNVTLSLCRLTEPFAPAQGGASTDAPAYDCASKLTASVSSDGTSYSFDLASLAAGSELAVAVLPTAATDRVVLSRPGPSSIETADASSSESSGTEPVNTSSNGAETSGSFTDVPAYGASPSFEIPGPIADAWSDIGSDLGLAETEPSTTGPAAAARSFATPVATAGTSDGGGGSVGAFLFFGTVGLAAALWAIAGRSREHADLGG